QEKRKLLGGDGGNKAVLREEHEVSRKAIAQGRPECSRCPVCSCAVLFAQIARETAGAASTRSSLRPLFRGGQTKMQTSGAKRREIAKSYLVSRLHPRRRPCERRDPYAAAVVVSPCWSTAFVQLWATVAMG